MRQHREAAACVVKCMAVEERGGGGGGKCQWGGGGFHACHKKLGVEVVLEVARSLDWNA
jgi:hypothetical protein